MTGQFPGTPLVPTQRAAVWADPCPLMQRISIQSTPLPPAPPPPSDPSPPEPVPGPAAPGDPLPP